MKILRVSIIIISAGILLLASCNKNADFLLFSEEDDALLGMEIADQLASDPTLDILTREQYPISYDYLESMLTDILGSDTIVNEDFPWTVHIINDDQVLNAFNTPGGQIYVYTGLIYFLDKEDDLAGALAHEIAHSDQRHGAKQLQRLYGISTLLSINNGGEISALTEIATRLSGKGTTLEYSRSAEAEADELAVRYLADSDYACNGAAAFFEKLIANEEQRQPAYLNAHPSDTSRVESINSIAAQIDCSTTVDDGSASRYVSFRNSLP